MKKFMAFILAVVMLVTLAACKKNDAVVEDQGELAGGFVKPESYASVLLVTINPQFRLYLDENSKVLAVEAVNDDADSIKDEISFEDKSAEDVVKTMIAVANEKGFVKAEATVTIEITETVMDDSYKNNVLTELVAAVNEKATELDLSISVSSADSTSVEDDQANHDSSQSSSSASASKSSSSSKSSKSSSSSSSSKSSSSSSSSKSSVSSSAGSSSVSSSSQSSVSNSAVSSSASASSKSEASSAPVVTYKDIRTGEWQLYTYIPDGYYPSSDKKLEKTFFFFDLEECGYGHVPGQGIYRSATYSLLSDLSDGEQKFARENGCVITYDGTEYSDNRSGGDLSIITDLKIENNKVSFTIQYYVHNEQILKEAVLTLEQISDNQLKVVSLSNSHPMIKIGDIFQRSYTSTTIVRPENKS